MLACAQATPPYVGVSDGLVGPGYVDLTDSLCRKGGIVRVASLTDAIDLLLGRRVARWPDAGSGYREHYGVGWRAALGV
jgi:hypothetical protein